LEASQKQLHSKLEDSRAAQSTLEGRVQELQTAKLEIEQQVKRLTETLAQETKRREGAEQQVGEIGKRRSELEAELARNAQAQAQLRQELDASQRQLNELQQSSQTEQKRFDTRSLELQAAMFEAEQQLKRLTGALALETKRRETAEEQTTHICKQRNDLEGDLTKVKLAEGQLRQELEAAQKQLQALHDSSSSERTRLEARTQEVLAAKLEAERQVQRLTDSLAQETARRQGVEKQVDDFSKRRSELEAQLTQNKQTQAQLQSELEELQKQLEAQRENSTAELARFEARTMDMQGLSHELAAVRSTLEEQTLQRRKLAEQVLEAEQAKAEFATQADAASALVKAHENSIFSLDLQVREGQGELNRLESLLQSEIVQRRTENSRAEALEKQAAELNIRLSEKIAEQQRWQQREFELQQQIRRQRAELANSAAAVGARDLELQGLRSTIEDLQNVQFDLRAKLRQITNQFDSAAKQIQDLMRERQATTDDVQSRDQELAAIRHAIFDAARIGSKISRERLQVERQTVDGWKSMAATLLHTPLSMAQRGLISEFIGALDAWKKGRADATNGSEFQVEPVDLLQSEFNCAEVIHSAFAAVKANANATGTKVQTAIVGPLPKSRHGSAKQIHQLITLLAAALPEVGRAQDLEVQASFEPKQNDTANILLSFKLTPTDDSNDDDLTLRLKNIAEASGSVPITRCAASELTLKAAWQLALAMGATPSIETMADGKVRVQILLPLA